MDTLADAPHSSLSGVARVLVHAGRLNSKTAEELVRSAPQGSVPWAQGMVAYAMATMMAGRNDDLERALARIPALREEFWQNVNVPGSDAHLNQALEKAGRVADFLEFAELMCTDALHREESCGGHFREEHETPDGEAKRDDAHFAYAAAWEFCGVGNAPKLWKEPLTLENVPLSQRSYK